MSRLALTVKDGQVNGFGIVLIDLNFLNDRKKGASSI